MKILKTDSFISERIKVQPITNAELNSIQKEFQNSKNPFGLTKDDLVGRIANFPMGVVVKMLEEQERQGCDPDVKVFQTNKESRRPDKGFDWDDTTDGNKFWTKVIRGLDFYRFFEKYPVYKRYNVPVEPNKYGLTMNDMTGQLEKFPLCVVVRMLEEQEHQGNKANVVVFQRDRRANFADGGFDWDLTILKNNFWYPIIDELDFYEFYQTFSEYTKYGTY